MVYHRNTATLAMTQLRGMCARTWWQFRRQHTSEHLNIWYSENFKIRTAAPSGAVRNVNENKFIHFTLERKGGKEEISAYVKAF